MSVLLKAAFCDHTEIPGDTRRAHQVVLVSVAYSVQILWLHWEFVIQFFTEQWLFLERSCCMDIFTRTTFVGTRLISISKPLSQRQVIQLFHAKRRQCLSESGKQNNIVLLYSNLTGKCKDFFFFGMTNEVSQFQCVFHYSKVENTLSNREVNFSILNDSSERPMWPKHSLMTLKKENVFSTWFFPNKSHCRKDKTKFKRGNDN